MWDILLATEQEAKQLAGNVLMSKAARIHEQAQDENYHSRCARGHFRWQDGRFFSKYGQVENVSIESGIATGDFVLQVTLTHQRFGKIPNALVCSKKRVLVVFEG